MKISKMGIRKQVLWLVLACSIITLLIAGGISLVGMFNIKSNAVNVGVEIGQTAANKSSEALKDSIKRNLNSIVNERSKQVDIIFETVKWDVQTLSDEMTTILQNPWNYLLRNVDPPNRDNKGIIVAQLQYRADVNPADVATEVGLTANLQDWLYIMNVSSEDMITSNYVASRNGFNITIDAASERRVDEYNNPLPNDYSVRPWYQKAMQEQKLTFTDVFMDSHGRGLALSCVAPYYNAYGEIAGVVGEGMLLENINNIVLNTKMGKTGFGFIIDKNGRVLFSPKDTGTLAVDSADDPSLFFNEDVALASAAKLMATGKSGLEYVNIDGVPCYLAFMPLKNTNWSFGMVIEESEIVMSSEVSRQVIEQSTSEFVGMLNNSIKNLILAMIGAFVAIVVLVPFAARKLADKFTEPINLLSDGVREIASGNLDKHLDIHTGNEIEHLAECFNAMTHELKNYMANLTKVTADKERIATELNVATNIQLSMLPRDFDFGRNDFEIFATMNAAKEVGGDFYDFYLLDENHLVVTIADVSGKGVPAALFMAISKTILKNFAMSMSNPDDFAAVMTLSNNQLCQGNDEMMFVTVFMGMLDLKTGKFIFVNGGHNPPMVYHSATGKFEYMDVVQNCVLGMMEDMDFEQQEIQLERGDILYLYTDGVTEAMDIDKNQYGEKKLSDCLNSVDKTDKLENILKDVRADLTKHVKDAEQSDDITMVAVRLNN